MHNYHSISLLKILEKSSRRGLGPGHLGVLVARAGLGKTACLIHVALDKLFGGQKLVHVSLEETPEKVMSYYEVMISELARVLGPFDEFRKRVEQNRMILAYLNQSFRVDRLRENIRNLVENIDFRPAALIVDGLDFETAGRALFEGFRDLAGEFEMEIWFSARSHRHLPGVNERGIPHPCQGLEDLFDLILQLQPEETGILLKLLKDHDAAVAPDAGVWLDPETFLPKPEE